MTDQCAEEARGSAPLMVVAAIIVSEDAVLACRRNADRSAGGLWEFPGGKIEMGETPEEALIREIDEELGVPILIDGHFSDDTTIVNGSPIRLICMRATLEGTHPIHSSDHDQLLWVPPATLEQLDWAAPDLPAVQRLTEIGIPSV